MTWVTSYQQFPQNVPVSFVRIRSVQTKSAPQILKNLFLVSKEFSQDCVFLFLSFCSLLFFCWVLMDSVLPKICKIFSIKLPSTKFLNKSRSKLAFISMLSFKKKFSTKVFLGCVLNFALNNKVIFGYFGMFNIRLM